MWPSSGCHDNFCGKSLGWFLRTKIILRGGMWRSDWFQYRRQIAHWVKHLTRGCDYRPIESVILSPRYNTFIIHINLNIYILLSAMYCAQDQSLTELEILLVAFDRILTSFKKQSLSDWILELSLFDLVNKNIWNTSQLSLFSRYLATFIY